MKQREQARIKVLNTVLEYHLPLAQAAEIMGISERHAKRLLAAYRKEGPARWRTLQMFRLGMFRLYVVQWFVRWFLAARRCS